MSALGRRSRKSFSCFSTGGQKRTDEAEGEPRRRKEGVSEEMER
jgi:hypothetical protein